MQNFPDLAAAVGLAGETVVAGTFAGAPGQALLLRFFANPDCDPSGHGEGRTFLGAVAVNPDGAGNAAFEAVLPPTAAGDRVTATASGPVGTSEFSACRTVEAGGAAAFAVADTAASEGARASLTVARSGSSALAASVRFATADGTARASGDYAPASGSLAFAPGQATQTIEVPVADDRAAEGDERFFVSLGDPTRVALGGPDTTTITIPGNDRGPDSNIVGLARSARAGALRRIAGTASDADGDLARVEVAIVGATGGARVAARRCLDITAAGRVRGRAAPRSGRCAPRTFLRATGRTRWTLRLRRALPRGRWVVFSRAVDRAGRRERSFTTRDRNRAAVRVR